MNNTLIKYGLIGIFNTFIGYGLTFLLFYIGILAELSNFIGYIIGFFVSYYLNKKYNFKSKNSHKKDMPKFIVSMLVAYIVNLIVFSLFYRYLEMNAYLSQVIAGIFYVAIGYILSKIYVFNGSENV